MVDTEKIKVKEKIRELLKELDNKPDLSFKSSLIDIAVGVALAEDIVSEGELKNKTADEKADLLKARC